VNKNLKYKQSTYFVAADLIDKIIEKFDYDVDEMHKLSIACMLIASKSDESGGMSLDQAVDEIGYNKYTKEEILESERFVLSTNKNNKTNNFLDFIIIVMNYAARLNTTVKTKRVESDGSMTSFYPGSSQSKKQLVRVTLSKSRFSLESDTVSTEAVKKYREKTSSVDNLAVVKVDSSYELEKQYENVVCLFSVCIYKMVRLEYDMFKNVDPLVLYFSIVYFSLTHVNSLFEFKGKLIRANIILELSEKKGINTQKIIDFCESLKKLYDDNSVNKGKFKFLNETEILSVIY